MTLTSKDAARVGLTKEVTARQHLVWDSTVARGLRTSAVMRDEVKEVVCPAFADSISEGDVRWEKAVGDSVAEDDVLCEIETDKTSVPVPSPAAGVITELLVEDGATVSPGTKLLKMKLGAGGGAPAAAKPATEAAAPPPPAAAAPPPPPPPPAAAAAPIPSTPPPPPPMPAAPKKVTPPPAPMPPRPSAGAAPVVRMPPADPTTAIAGTRSEHRVKMNRMRLKIASRLKEAQNTNAMLTTFNELDMSNIMQLRKENQDAFVKKHGIKMGFMSAFVKASAYGLTKQPTVNAVIDGQETLYRDYVDISVAVATPKVIKTDSSKTKRLFLLSSCSPMIRVQILGMEPTLYLFFFRAWWSLFSEMLRACPTLILKRGLRLWDKRPRTTSWLWRTWTEEPLLLGELLFPLVL